MSDRQKRKSSNVPGKQQVDRISRKKMFLFRGIAIASPFILLFIVEVSLHLFPGEIRDPYVNVSPFHIFTKVNIDGVEYAQITHNLAYAERNVKFSVRKPDNTIRIFLLGGSACAGWPHPAQETFAAYLQQALQSVLFNQRVEVINASAHGFASYRIRYILDELIEMDPDAILIYSGNNEFLEKREYATVDLMAIDRIARKLKTVHWMRSYFLKPKTELSGEKLKDVALFFYKKVKQQALEIREDPIQFEKIKTHYRHSIEYMVRKATGRKVPVLLCTVPVNLRDWLPTVSHNRLTDQALLQWQQLYNLGRRCYLEGQYEEGADYITRAIQLEPEHAESHFWLGRLLEKEHPSKAFISYSRARDLDYNPFRAISAFNDSLRAIARNNKTVFLVGLENSFKQASESGIPGFDLFLDYVHPNTQGNVLIAKKVFAVIAENNILDQLLDATSFKENYVTYRENGTEYDDTLDVAIQERLFGLYVQSHQHRAAIEKARYLYTLTMQKELMPQDGSLPVSFKPVIREGYEALLEYETMHQKWILEESVDPNEIETANKKLQEYYEKWFGYGRF